MKISSLGLALTLISPLALASNTTETLPESIEAKLSHQYDLYEQGKPYLVDRIAHEKTTVNRSEWESFLTPRNESLVMTQADIAALQDHHQRIIQQAAEKAKAESIIDLDFFRTDKQAVQDFCLAFPRIALLHIHPPGTIKQATAAKAMAACNPMIDPQELMKIGTGDLTMLYDNELEYLRNLEGTSTTRYLEYSPEDQQKLLDFLFLPLDPCCHDFPRFEALFYIQSYYFTQSPENQTYFTSLYYDDFLERNRAFGIEHVEFTEVLWPPAEEMEEYGAYLNSKAQQHNMTLNYNQAFVRTAPADLLHDFTLDFIDALTEDDTDNSLVVGIDLLAEETGNHALEQAQGIYVPISNAIQTGSIKLGGLTMHAGEHGDHGALNVRDGILMGITRIGHGVLIEEDPIVLEYNRRQKVPMVLNIASNWQLNAIEDDTFRNHPFLDLLRLGIPLTLSTDDEGMFHTDIVHECDLAIKNTDIQYSELKAISYTAVTASFAEESLKQSLLSRLDDKFAAFEEELLADEGMDMVEPEEGTRDELSSGAAEGDNSSATIYQTLWGSGWLLMSVALSVLAV